ncbi:glycoside hydrolase family 88/105 protein [Actinoallomurus sp. CA-150999]|uniref:glycoside hydrolase family 88/105 protein n=1 Tax=Actinoallomurus sp. CA-150999 TaxID=3239887 RepID=UPI003D8C9BFC
MTRRFAMDRRRFLTAAALAGGSGLALSAVGGRPATAGVGRAAPSPVLPSRAEVIAVLRRVNDHWIGAHTDPGDDKWARATYFSGDLALHRLTGDGRYLDYARTWAEKWSYGLNTGVSTRLADNQCAGQAYLDLNEVEPAKEKVAAIEESLRLMVEGSDAAKDDDWWWVDALHMAMPPFARVGSLLGDTRYWDKMDALYAHTKNVEGGHGLYRAADALWWRDKRFVLPGGTKSPNGKSVYWSRGNGWALAAFAKVLPVLPAGRAKEYRARLQAMAAALRKVQRSDGFWNVDLGDPAHLPGPETSGTALFAYGIAYGVGAGLLDRATYLPVVARAWNGMVATAVHPDGVLGYVQGVGYEPESSQPVTYDGTTDFGVGGFLLAGTEVARLTT